MNTRDNTENDSYPNNQADNDKKHSPKRRTFLLGLGSTMLVVGVGGKIGWDYLKKNISSIVENSAPPANVPAEDMLWFSIAADNVVTFHVPKIEMGQGIHTSLAQIAADELDADWNLVRVRQADTAFGYDAGLLFTGGSTSVASLYLPLRESAARVRETLKKEAALLLKVPLENLRTANGFVFDSRDVSKADMLKGDATKKISFGEIIKKKKGDWSFAKKAELKQEKDFVLIGKPLQRVDIRDKVTGKAKYGLDTKFPNMLYGAVARPPRYGAVLKSANAGEAAKMKGVVKVVIEKGFAGVVAERRSIARAAAALIECEWEGGTTINQNEIDAIVTVKVENPDAVIIQEKGSTGKELSEQGLSGDVLTAEYRVPTAAHAHLEPQAALADVRADGITIFASTQTPDIIKMMVSSALEVEKDSILVKPMYAGGGFGRRGAHDVGLEAALLSRSVGRPVHLGWTREEEMRYGYYRPPSHHKLFGKIDDKGKIHALEHSLISGDVILAMAPMAAGKVGEAIADAFGIDPGATTGALFEYDIPHHQVISHRAKLPFLTASWRGLGLLPNAFARESFIDELAHAAKKDPLQYRIDHLPDTELGVRYKTALTKAKEISFWNTNNDGRAKGVALALHAQTVCVQIAEVSLQDGRLKVNNVWAVADPGLVVNPNGAMAQIQGGINMGLSSVFHEAISFSKGLAEAANFDTYPLLTLGESPKITVEILQSSQTPHGMGEVGVGPIAAAVANAAFALTGKRIRTLPFPQDSFSS